MSTGLIIAIFVVVALVAVGILIDNLFRLRTYLNKTPPPSPEVHEVTDTDS